MSLYTQTSYFDFSATASCGGSPIIVSSVGTGCNAAFELNSNGATCSSYDTSSEYKLYSNRCSMNALDLGNYTRNYVVKTIYTTSEKCEGNPLQAFALAADSTCHQNPSGDNSTAYIRTNCNGGQPIWEECSDATCTKCTTTRFTDTPCQLAGAGTSNKVECYTSPSKTPKNGNNGTDTEPLFPDPFANSVGKLNAKTINVLYVALISIALVFPYL